MKKNTLLLLILISTTAFGQVGINTETPKATLDVVATPLDATKIDGFIAPRISGNDLASKDALYTSAQTGAIVYATAAVSSPTVKTTNVTSVGYYYFDGAVWIKMIPAAVTGDNGLTKTGNNIQLGGTLLKNTEITTAGFNTSFSGTGNVGIGTNNPTEKLDVGTGNVRVRTINTNIGTATTDNIVVADSNGVLKTIPKQNTVLFGGDFVDISPNFVEITSSGVAVRNTIKEVTFTVDYPSLVTFDYQLSYTIRDMANLGDGKTRRIDSELQFTAVPSGSTIPIDTFFAAIGIPLAFSSVDKSVAGQYYFNGSQTLKLIPGNYTIKLTGGVYSPIIAPFTVRFGETPLDFLTITAQTIQ